MMMRGTNTRASVSFDRRAMQTGLLQGDGLQTLLTWYITDNLADVTAEEFDTNWTGIYGFVSFHFFRKPINFFPTRTKPVDGNNDILYWMHQLVACGLAIAAQTDFECRLLCFDRLRIHVHCDDTIMVSLVEGDTKRVLSRKVIDYDGVVAELTKEVGDFLRYMDKKFPQLQTAQAIAQLRASYLELEAVQQKQPVRLYHF